MFDWALVVQEGMVPEDLPWDDPRWDVLFVGGGAPGPGDPHGLRWKDGTAPEWCAAAHEHGRACHIGRVMSAQRVKSVRVRADPDSIDSGGVAYTIPKVKGWVRALQEPLTEILLANPERERLPAGTRLYHATKTRTHGDFAHPFRYPRGPAWFTDHPGIAWDFAGEKGRVIKYRTRADLDLRGYELDDWATGEGAERADVFLDDEEEVCATDDAGWHVPDYYDGKGSDTMLCDPEEVLQYLDEEDWER